MRSSLLIAFLFVAAVPADAAEVTWQAAMRAAVDHRPVAQAARAQAAEATQRIAEARSGWLPHLFVSERYLRTNEPAGSLFIALNQERDVMADQDYSLTDPGAQDDFETRIELTQTLYNPDTDYGLRRAYIVHQTAAANASWSAEEAAFAAFQAYLDVQHAETALAWVASSRMEAEEIVRLASERYRGGIGLKADELRAGVHLAEARRREVSASNDLLLARRRLALAMGEERGEMQIVRPLSEGDFASTPLPESVGHRADLAALTHQVETARLTMEEARAAWLPSVDVMAHYAWHDEHNPFDAGSESWAIGAELRWEAFDGLRRGAAETRSEAASRAEELRFEEARRESNFRFEEARLRAEESRWLRDSAQQAVDEAKEGQRLYQQRYAAGLADLAELLTAQSALDRARYDAAGAETKRLLALGNVFFQAGRFLTAFLPEKENRP